MLAEINDDGKALVDAKVVLDDTIGLVVDLCDDLDTLQRAIYNIEICMQLYMMYPTNRKELIEKTEYFTEQFFDSLPCKPSELVKRASLVSDNLRFLKAKR